MIKNSILFTTKAETLESVSVLLKSAKVLPQFRFTVAQWKTSPASVIHNLTKVSWVNQELIVRSSSISEDGKASSLAGHFESVLHLRGLESVKAGIEKVISSFGENPNGEDQIFIQPMLMNVRLGGVVFSRDPNTGSPYLVINYDDESGSTDTVTSGQTNALKTVYIYKGKIEATPLPLVPIANLVTELEQIFELDALDIEFAVTLDGELYLFQVRPLQINSLGSINFNRQTQVLDAVERKLETLMRPHPYLHGQKAIFGIMPDWNPAEIIGVRPSPFALSLYKELITDNIWAYQRDNYGYKNLRSFPLLISFAGLPYIDVRVSFNSFIPEDVSPELSEKLVNHYIEQLVHSPSYHDKVEFEIIFSCYSLDLPDRLAPLLDKGFTSAEISQFSESLRLLTNNIIHGDRGLWKNDIEKIEKLEQRRKTILESNLDKVSKIYWLLEDCKRYGTLPFAGLARAGFIAVQLLRSFVKVGILNTTEFDEFLGQLETVSSETGRDFHTMSRREFLEKYGHLRPGTYDILSPRYDETPERYFDWGAHSSHVAHEKGSFRLSLGQMRSLELWIAKHKLEHSALGIFDFIKSAIEGREYSKFVFTKSLSDAMSLFKELALDNGISVNDCSFADIEVVRTLYASSQPIEETLRESVRKGRAAFELTKQIVLPPLLIDAKDVWAFTVPISEPNYITMKRVSGQTAILTDDNSEIDGKILFIQSADPGFDWIFSRHIVGFITMYGGTNSHMAIRAGELGIPAVIGAGEVLYNQWVKSKVIEIDCGNRQVKVLR